MPPKIDISWTEPSTCRVSSPRVWLVGKKPDPWMTHPVADLALKVAGRWWTRLAQILFRLLNASYFELFYCWLAWGTPISSVHCECFQFRNCDTKLTSTFTLYIKGQQSSPASSHYSNRSRLHWYCQSLQPCLPTLSTLTTVHCLSILHHYHNQSPSSEH